MSYTYNPFTGKFDNIGDTLVLSTKKNITQAAHGFIVGNILKLTGTTTYAKAKADSSANAEVVGVVSAVADADNFTLLNEGYITGLSGLTAATTYFLSPTIVGAFTSTEPTAVTQVSKPLLITDTTTSGYFSFSYRGLLIPAVAAAPANAQYVTLATDATLTNERVLTGTPSQVILTDAGAGSTITLSLPQNIATSSTPTFAGLNSGGSILPTIDNTYDLGSTSLRWKTLHVGPGSVVIHNDATNTAKATLGFTGSIAQLIAGGTGAETLQLSVGSANGITIGSSGLVGVGTTNPSANGYSSAFVVAVPGGVTNSAVASYTDTATGSTFLLLKARGTESSPTAVLSGDSLGSIAYRGYDGTANSFNVAGGSVISVSATENWSSSAHGSTLSIQTTSNGSITPSTRITVLNSGFVGIGNTTPTHSLDVTGNLRVTTNVGIGGVSFTNDAIAITGTAGITAGTSQFGIIENFTFNSAGTTAMTGFRAVNSTPAAAFNVTDVRNFWSSNMTLGAGSSITNQYGFATDDLTVASNNYGFHSNVSAGATRWAFYAAGTAVSAFGGAITPLANDGSAIGTTALQWSDIFLATGAVLNYGNGNVTVTHSSNVLTTTANRVEINVANNTASDSFVVTNTSVATTTPSARFVLQGPAANDGFSFQYILNSDTSGLAGVVLARNSSTVATAESRFQQDGARPVNFYTNGSQRLQADGNGNIVPGTAALATNATNGFTYIQTCAGTPTGVPTTFTGRAAMIFDSTNSKLYVYNGGWVGVTLA